MDGFYYEGEFYSEYDFIQGDDADDDGSIQVGRSGVDSFCFSFLLGPYFLHCAVEL